MSLPETLREAASLWWLSYPLVGAFSGFVAGLFGVGGGLTIVPVLLILYTAQDFPLEHTMHLALGTAMATIAINSLSSMRAHNKHGVVRWDIVRAMAPGLILGTFGGSLFASYVPTRPLAFAFAAITYYASIQMMLDFKPRPSRALPGRAGLFGVGGGIGVISSLVAAGGGFMSIPFMLWSNVAMHQAVGTSAALGLPIAVAGLVGYVLSGWGAAGRPDFSLGYVYLPALAGIIAVSMLAAPLGARVAHRLPAKKLKRAFGGFLGFLATLMLYRLLG